MCLWFAGVDRDRYGGDRDRYGGDRDRHGGDRDSRYGGDRDGRYGGNRGGDRYGGDRDRDRYGGDRDRDGGRSYGGDRDRRGFGGDRDRRADDDAPWGHDRRQDDNGRDDRGGSKFGSRDIRYENRDRPSYSNRDQGDRQDRRPYGGDRADRDRGLCALFTVFCITSSLLSTLTLLHTCVRYPTSLPLCADRVTGCVQIETSDQLLVKTQMTEIWTGALLLSYVTAN